jgi:hypothetical protein
MEHDRGRPAHDHLSDRELAFFTLEILLVAVAIFTLIHFRSTTAAIFAVGSLLVAAMVAGATSAQDPSPEGRAVRPAARRRRQAYRRGDYRATSDELFRIEQVDEDRALVENCRTEELIDVGLEELDALRPVRSVNPGRAREPR